EKKIGEAEFQIKAPPPVPTLGAYSEQFMAGYAAAKLKPSTQYGYKRGLKDHILPAFGKRILTDITRKDIKDFIYAKTADGYAPRSVLGMVHKMSAIFEDAIEDGIVKVNPTRRPGKHVRIPKMGEGMDFLTQEEGGAVLNAARAHFPKMYPALLLTMMTGMRQGEIIALQWGDIDWRGKFLVVQRNDWKGYLGTPKNGHPRRIDLAEYLIEVLADHRRRVAEEALASGKPMMEWVFPRRYYFPAKSTGGERLKGDGMRKILDLSIKKAGIRHVKFHALRHSYCSWMIKAGENLTYIMQQAGHSSINVTVNTYGTQVPGDHRDATDRLAAKLMGKSATQAQPAISVSCKLPENIAKIS
ncbi:MAG: site-specific integrase, partial [Deltaproteobacteria bacterium]|nr:site-specific integrase [Deltaproteobacteria bacterium]